MQLDFIIYIFHKFTEEEMWLFELLKEYWCPKWVLMPIPTSYQVGLPRMISWRILLGSVRKRLCAASVCVLWAWVWTGACTCLRLVNVCAWVRMRERLVWSQTQWTHYLSADKCHQLQLLGGLCGRAGERGQTGVRVLLEGDRLQGMGVLGGWQSNGWGRWQHGHAEWN